MVNYLAALDEPKKWKLKQAESIRKLWLRCCTWVTFFGTIIFIDRDKVRQVLQSATILLQSATVITNWDDYSKVEQVFL